jgi:hypothetical protein
MSKKRRGPRLATRERFSGKVLVTASLARGSVELFLDSENLAQLKAALLLADGGPLECELRVKA